VDATCPYVRDRSLHGDVGHLGRGRDTLSLISSQDRRKAIRWIAACSLLSSLELGRPLHDRLRDCMLDDRIETQIRG